MQVPPTEEEQDGLAGGLAEQAPEDAAAVGERLAAHIEVPPLPHCVPFSE